MKNIDLKHDDYAQSANTIFNFMKKSSYLKEILQKKAIIPRYCKENFEYLNIHNKALNHLNMAHVIRPKAYQIQHAIGRNYLKYANYLNDSIQADTLFKQGEEIMLELIRSSEYNKEKAKNYSIHCYVLEKIQYIKRHKKSISNKELLQIKQYIDMIKNDKDVYIDSMVIRYMNLLKDLDKLNIISMKPNDIYFQALRKKDKHDYEQDVLVESY